MTAEHKLLTLRQGGKIASAYYSEFTTYASILSLDEGTKISFFRRGVNEELSLALSYQINLPTTFASFAQMCITFDNQVKIRKTRTKELSVNRARFLEPAPVIRPLPDPEPQVNKPQANEPQANEPQAGEPMDLSLASQSRGPLSKAEKGYRRQNNLCNRCGSPGHYARHCPHMSQAPVGSSMEKGMGTSAPYTP